jgi:hypothetical protein
MEKGRMCMKRVTRPLAFTALLVAVLLVIAACGSDSTATPTGSAPTNTPEATATTAPGETPEPTTTSEPSGPTATPTSSFDAAEVFSGNTVKLITGTSPGGGYDTMLRIFAKVAPKYFPEDTGFAVQNLPGAGQLRGLQAVLNAEPDGLTTGPTHQRWFIQQILFGDVEGLDLETLSVVGSPTYRPSPQLFCADSSVATTWQQVIDQGITLRTGQTAPGNSPGPEFIDLIGGPIENVYGYGGSAEVMAAFDRGEINSIWGCGPQLAGRLFPEWIENGRLAPLFWWEAHYPDDWYQQLGVVKEDIPNVKDLAGLNMTDLEKRAFDNWVRIATISRTFLLPAGVPDEIVEYWQETFKKVVEDPEFIESTEIAGYAEEYGYAGGDEIKDTLLEMNELPPEVKEVLQGIAPQA